MYKRQELPGLTVSGERMADKAAAEQVKETCRGANVTIKKVECKEKSEKPPALYDLSTLQRDANRLLGFTAQMCIRDRERSSVLRHQCSVQQPHHGG